MNRRGKPHGGGKPRHYYTTPSQGIPWYSSGDPCGRHAACPSHAKTRMVHTPARESILLLPGEVTVQLLAGHSDWVLALAFAPDGRTLASGSLDLTVKLWDVERGDLRQTLAGHTDRVHTVAWSPDGRTVASAGFDETIWLWDVESSSYRTALHAKYLDPHTM